MKKSSLLIGMAILPVLIFVYIFLNGTLLGFPVTDLGKMKAKSKEAVLAFVKHPEEVEFKKLEVNNRFPNSIYYDANGAAIVKNSFGVKSEIIFSVEGERVISEIAIMKLIIDNKVMFDLNK